MLNRDEETLDDLWSHYNNDELILLFEDNDDKDPYWSREAIMDAYQYTPSYPPIRRVNASSRSDLVERFRVTSLPAMVFLERRSGKAELYNIKPSRSFFGQMMTKFFGDSNKKEPELPKPVESAKVNSKGGEVLHKPAAKDQVYMADLEGAVMYAMGHEVVLRKLIATKELTALKEFIRVLDEYLPARPALKSVLSSMRNKLAGYKKSIRGQEFAQLWEESLGGQAFSKEWVGCKGSKSHLRGYPCSLWTTFHTLTVNYARLREPDSKEPPGLVLNAMKGHIQYFFGCAHCSNHFVDRTEDEANPIESVRSPQEAILWLWEAHNKVNRRISGDASEDPTAPKIIFPSPDNCPGCNEDKKLALDYLMRIYSEENISSAGLSLSLAASDGRHPAESSAGSSIHSAPMGSLSFTSYDVSLYALIYLASSVILLVVLARMFLHKRLVRKYIYDVCSQC